MPIAQHALHHEISTLYAEHHGWLQHWLRRRLGNPGEAADLAQDMFLKLLTAPAATVAGVREPRPYLATVARRLLLDHLRRQLTAVPVRRSRRVTPQFSLSLAVFRLESSGPQPMVFVQLCPSTMGAEREESIQRR